MTRKRKRDGSISEQTQTEKRMKEAGTSLSSYKHSLLHHFYGEVRTLREYLLCKLPADSKARRKKIQSIGRSVNVAGDPAQNEPSGNKLSKFLDETLIGVTNTDARTRVARRENWIAFSQKLDETKSTLCSVNPACAQSQSEVVDFCIWLLLTKGSAGAGAKHLLCQGYRRASNRQADDPLSTIPGMILAHRNDHIVKMKSSPWPEILAVMGKSGEATMVDLIIDCSIFIRVQGGEENYWQMSGQPLGDLKPVTRGSSAAITIRESARKPGSIVFVRNRMLYARAALNAKGGVRFGLRHIHVLNRYPYRETEEGESQLSGAVPSTVHVAMYLFPRQFGLHNVFTSVTDSRETVQPFKDYTLREDEIETRFAKAGNPACTDKIPKRLRGEAISLVRQLQKLHHKCSYKMLLEHYCPTNESCSFFITEDSCEMREQSSMKTQATPLTCLTVSDEQAQDESLQKKRLSLLEHATSSAEVSAFCRAVLTSIVPKGFWGEGPDQEHNREEFMTHVDRFVKMRRFESLSLHDISQRMRINKISWLAPNNLTLARPSQFDTFKRQELFHELLYYLFDSLLIPLIRANFHVTESNTHRYRLFYFRHDVWRLVAEPALAGLKSTMFEEVELNDARKILDSRTLGFSQIRLLPKDNGVRPIMNLRRRTLKKGYKTMLGSSINSILSPAFNMLSYEKSVASELLGSSLFSVGDLYPRIKAFLNTFSTSIPSLFFAKVDVQAAFDTIPQASILKLITSLPRESQYRISKHLEIKSSDGNHLTMSEHSFKPVRKYVSTASASTDNAPFNEKFLGQLGQGKKGIVFVDNIVPQYRDTWELLGLLIEHIQHNMVKIGKKFYRQKEGIPQGSVVSSLLCNYFYANLEAKHLAFLQSGNSLLVRLIDDFLLITTDREHAKKFLQVMHDGIPEYGVYVNPAKTLTNFEVAINGHKVTRLVGDRQFPYCGNLIDLKTLTITKDRGRKRDLDLSDSLTVEFSRTPGRTYQRKIFNTFKIQAHAMFLDTSMNSMRTVLSTIYGCFVESATKMWAYTKCLPALKRPGPSLVIRTIDGLISLAFVLMKSKSKNPKNLAAGYRCSVSLVQVEWLAATAFKDVLRKKQSNYAEVLVWLEQKLGVLRVKKGKEVAKLEDICKKRVVEV